MIGDWEETLTGILEEGGDLPRFASSLSLAMMTAICNRHNAALATAVETERNAIAEYVRTWGGRPPSPRNARGQLADEIKAGKHHEDNPTTD